MKKYLNLSGICYALFFLSFISLSCKKQIQEDLIEKTSPETFSDSTLILKLKAYNQTHGYKNSQRCSGFWGCFGNVLGVSGADIIGFGTGIWAAKEIAGGAGAVTGGAGAAIVMGAAGVICGAGASYLASQQLYLVNPAPLPVLKYSNLDVNLPQDFEYLQDVGIEHNNVLHNNFFHGQSLQSYYTAKNLTTSDLSILNSPQMASTIAKINAASEDYSSTLDHDALTQRLYDSSLINANIKDVLDLFLDEYSLSTSGSEIETTINYYISEVANSTLSNDEKETLFGSFMVASESPFYFLEMPPVTINGTNTSTKTITLLFKNLGTDSNYTFTLSPGTFELGSVPYGQYDVLMTPVNYSITYPIVSKLNSFTQTYYAAVAYGNVKLENVCNVEASPPPPVSISGSNTTSVLFFVSFKNLATNVTYPFILNGNNTFQGSVPEGIYDVLMSPLTYNPSSPNKYKIYSFTQTYYATVAFGNLQVSAACPILITK